MEFIQSFKQKLHNAFQWFQKISVPKKALIIIGVLLLSYFSYTRLVGTQTKKPEYLTATVEQGTLITSITASGTVSTGNNVQITTSATGTVNAVYVSNGDTVIVGQKIADITPDQNSQQKQAAAYASYLGSQNSLNSAKSRMNSLQSALFKANQTFVTGTGTTNPITDDPRYIEQRADWLQAEADYNNQQGVIAQAEASLTSASLAYQQTASTITAPTNGVITNLTLTPGLALTSSNSTSDTTSTTTTSYGSISPGGEQLQANVNLSEIDVTKVKVGQKVTLTLDAFSDKTFIGKITTINTNGSVSSNVTTYPATIAFDAGQNTIYPNMGISAQIITSVKPDVLLIPSSAITGSGESATVRVMKNGQIQQVPVEVGEANDTQTEITSGLSEGDTIVTGSPVTTQTQSGTGTTTTSPFGAGGLGGGNRVFVGGSAGGANRISR